MTDFLKGMDTQQYSVGIAPADAPSAFVVRVTWYDGSQWYHERSWGEAGNVMVGDAPMTKDRDKAHVFHPGEYCPAWDDAGGLTLGAEVVAV